MWTLDMDWQRNLWDAWKVHWGLSKLSLDGNDGNKGEGWCRGSYQRALVLPFHLFCEAGAAGLGSRPRRGERRGAGVCDAGHRGPSVVLAIRTGVLWEIGESRAEVTLSLGVSDKARRSCYRGLWKRLADSFQAFCSPHRPVDALSDSSFRNHPSTHTSLDKPTTELVWDTASPCQQTDRGDGSNAEWGARNGGQKIATVLEPEDITSLKQIVLFYQQPKICKDLLNQVLSKP